MSSEAEVIRHLGMSRWGSLDAGRPELMAMRPGDLMGGQYSVGNGQLGESTRAGSILANLIAAGAGPWVLVALRWSGPPSGEEVEAARRIMRAGDVVGVVVERVWFLNPAHVLGAVAVEREAGAT